MRGSVRHVLFDADGVLQYLPGGWAEAMRPFLGARAEEFLRETLEVERPALAGRGAYLPLLAESLTAYGVETPVEEVYRSVWHNITVVEESLALVTALRRSGYGVHLGTNQEPHRAAYMRETLGYDALFDVSCYSCELGFAKPDPGFFAEAARRIGSAPEAILFIDDNHGNVGAARTAGLPAVQWDHGQGHPTLLELLGAHGVAVA